MTFQSPTRVVPKHRKPAGYLIRVSARAGGSDDRVSSSPRAGTLSIRVILPAPHPVVFLPTCGGGPLRRSVEPTRTLMAPLLRFSRGPREILNFCRRLQASGGLSFLRIPFVDHCSEATNSIFRRFQIPPIGAFLSPAVHGQTMQHKDTRDHGNSYPQHG